MSVLEQFKQNLQQELTRAIERAGLVESGQIPDIMLEIPKEKEHGDLSTNIAMQLTRIARRNPREIASAIVEHFDQAEAGIDKVEIAGPGFINFFTNKCYLYDVIREAIGQGERYGSSDIGGGQSVQVEFVSANPTGSLHLGHARGAAVGDALCNVLEFAGYKVTREYYINDAGNQVDNLALSLEARYLQALGEEAEMPADGYYGDDIKEFAQELVEKEGRRLLDLPQEERFKFFREYALTRELDKIRRDLERFGVHFDVWYSETSLYKEGKVEAVLDELKAKGHVYEQDGAVWLKTTPHGDDKDRVLVKQDGSYTYLTPDIAYHKEKFARGFERLINIWGADHHGYIPRLKAAVSALGFDAERLEILIVQMVSLYQGGEKVKMSKRTGKAVTLEELVDEVGKDAVRYFFTMRNTDTHLDFDLDLAVSRSNDNPVYYVQYAHARICSIFRQAEEQGIRVKPVEEVDLSALDKEAEFDLMMKMGEFKSEVEAAAEQRAPHRIVRYVYELASMFHSYYRAERVIGADEKEMQARFALLAAIRTVIHNALRLIGVSAPDKM